MFWIDLFSLSQHLDLVDGALEGWLSLVREHVARIDYTLVVLSPWDASKPLTRAWCLYEIFCGLQAPTKNVQFVMSPHEWSALRALAQRDCALAAAAMCVEVDLEQSECYIVDDKLGLVFTVQSRWGFNEFNRQVGWFIATACSYFSLLCFPFLCFMFEFCVLSLCFLFAPCLLSDNYRSAFCLVSVYFLFASCLFMCFKVSILTLPNIQKNHATTNYS